MRHRSAARIAGGALSVLAAFAVLPGGAANAEPTGEIGDIISADGTVDDDAARRLGVDPQKVDVKYEDLGNGASAVTAVVPDDGQAKINSSHGCNKSVCITLTGKGLKVDKWESSGRVYQRWCSKPMHWEGVRVYWSPRDAICSNGPAYFYSRITNPGWFVHNTQLCNTWIQQPIPGRPCKRVLR